MRPVTQSRRRHVERVVDARVPAARCARLSVSSRPRRQHFVGVARLDRNGVAVGERPVDRRRRQRPRRTARRCRAPRAPCRRCRSCCRHRRCARRDRRRRGRCRRRRAASAARSRASTNSVCGTPRCAQFPRGEIRALQARPRLAHPDVHRNALGMREKDRRRRRAPAAGRQRAGVAMGHARGPAERLRSDARAAARGRARRSHD